VSSFQQRWPRFESAAQLRQLAISALKEGGGLPVSGVVMIDQGSEFRNLFTQGDVLDALPLGCLKGL
jgi:hypothetical protein